MEDILSILVYQLIIKPDIKPRSRWLVPLVAVDLSVALTLKWPFSLVSWAISHLKKIIKPQLKF